MTATFEGLISDQLVAPIIKDRGDESDGAITVAAPTNVSTLGAALAGLPGEADGRILNVTSLTIDAGQTLTLDVNITIIKSTGKVTIAGAIDGDAQGMAGGIGPVSAAGVNRHGAGGQPPYQGNGGVGLHSLTLLYSQIAGGRYPWRDWLFDLSSAEPDGLNFPVGGGGGSGGANNGSGGAWTGGAGGNGGACLIIIAPEIEIPSGGSITCDGAVGGAVVVGVTDGGAGGGGGGGGGFVGLFCDTFDDQNAAGTTISAVNGVGGAGGRVNAGSGSGGGGGGAVNGTDGVKADAANAGGIGGTGMAAIFFTQWWEVNGVPGDTTALAARTDPDATVHRVAVYTPRRTGNSFQFST